MSEVSIMPTIDQPDFVETHFSPDPSRKCIKDCAYSHISTWSQFNWEFCFLNRLNYQWLCQKCFKFTVWFLQIDWFFVKVFLWWNEDWPSCITHETIGKCITCLNRRKVFFPDIFYWYTFGLRYFFLDSFVKDLTGHCAFRKDMKAYWKLTMDHWHCLVHQKIFLSFSWGRYWKILIKRGNYIKELKLI